ncbi:hypothetical protein PHISCL_01973 [Aspergillus sclerotialis]|uniref:HCP-like protein n=1 Tax=Aspergillus sclerotialis TaxID=2070753 RepID=A0A3A2ZSK2_9EURO|nr:hypothetical protein PHISCL_01973 [Aspergillus sclerotialis]
MPIRDLLQKRDKISDSSSQYTPTQSDQPSVLASPIPEIKFIRSDTTSQEVIDPPIYDDEQEHHSHPVQFPQDPHAARPSSPDGQEQGRRRLSLFRRSRSPSESSRADASPPRVRGERRLSQLLHLDRGSRNSSRSSVNIPADLPQIVSTDGGDEQDKEAQWEKRATLLVSQNPQFGGHGLSPRASVTSFDSGRPGSRGESPGRVSDPQGDINIQEAIRLHEAGELEVSTKMFRQLADPNGANNALSQVLYGLALRHGWGCTEDPERAVTYLTAAASNSASVETEALRAGMKKGGAAKGELVLAIYELANCFRNGWGVQKDPVAARQYYETAANLGDSDAMNEVAWCYLEGVGGKKDKVSFFLTIWHHGFWGDLRRSDGLGHQ